uniref:Transmembrane protein n=1 Tax=Macrostomum lignano TaxID=282301 RepID=A0A1I8F2X9_9PLAT
VVRSPFEQYRNLSAQNLSANAVLASEEFFDSRPHQSSGIDRLGSAEAGARHLLLCGLHLPVLLAVARGEDLWKAVDRGRHSRCSTQPAPALSGSTCLASYSSKNQQLLPDSLIATAANVSASFLAGFVVFSYLGLHGAE